MLTGPIVDDRHCAHQHDLPGAPAVRPVAPGTEYILILAIQSPQIQGLQTALAEVAHGAAPRLGGVYILDTAGTTILTEAQQHSLFAVLPAQ